MRIHGLAVMVVLCLFAGVSPAFCAFTDSPGSVFTGSGTASGSTESVDLWMPDGKAIPATVKILSRQQAGVLHDYNAECIARESFGNVAVGYSPVDVLSGSSAGGVLIAGGSFTRAYAGMGTQGRLFSATSGSTTVWHGGVPSIVKNLGSPMSGLNHDWFGDAWDLGFPAQLGLAASPGEAGWSGVVTRHGSVYKSTWSFVYVTRPSSNWPGMFDSRWARVVNDRGFVYSDSGSGLAISADYPSVLSVEIDSAIADDYFMPTPDNGQWPGSYAWDAMPYGTSDKIGAVCLGSSDTGDIRRTWDLVPKWGTGIWTGSEETTPTIGEPPSDELPDWALPTVEAFKASFEGLGVWLWPVGLYRDLLGGA